MKALTALLILTVAVGCTRCGRREAAPEASAALTPVAESYVIDGAPAWVRMPSVPVSGPIPWVLFTPAIAAAGMPSASQHAWYFERLSQAGVAVIGIDTGESYGSPTARQQIRTFLTLLRTKGFAQSGCSYAQSRGGLQTYGFAADSPGFLHCIAGIYPLLSLTDYAGVAAFAPAWGMTEAAMQAQLNTISPHNRTAEIAQTPGLRVLHVHGTTDTATSYAVDQQFLQDLTTRGVSTDLITVPGLGHEWTAPEFFQNEAVIDFLIQQAKGI